MADPSRNPPDLGENQLGLYVHWPFCAAKCPYCDFNSHVAQDPVDQQTYAADLIRELEHFRGLTGQRSVTTVFFGGGTPSLMRPETVSRLLDGIAGLWPLARDAEITLEANPASSDAANFAGYRKAGVSRLSLGVQALDDRALKFLGRLHSVDEALGAVAAAAYQFERISADMIYARPGQSLDDWRRELAGALTLPVEHLSLYQLTIEPGTPFAALHARGKLNPPAGGLAGDLYALTGDMCADAGFEPYEISNYAQPGAVSRHNLIYWRYLDYVGAGPGAHSRLRDDDTVRAFETARDPADWRDCIARAGHAVTTRQSLTPAEAGDEFLLMGLRLSCGIDPAGFTRLSGLKLDQAVIHKLENEGLLAQDDDACLSATAAGRFVLDRVIAELSLSAMPAQPVA
jgi:oxygen-independent coproporphyrinogen-3 oxidase